MVPQHRPYHGPSQRKYYLVWKENNANFESCDFHKELWQAYLLVTASQKQRYVPVITSGQWEQREDSGFFLTLSIFLYY